MNKKTVKEILNKLPDSVKKKIVQASKEGKKIRIKINKKVKEIKSPYENK